MNSESRNPYYGWKPDRAKGTPTTICRLWERAEKNTTSFTKQESE